MKQRRHATVAATAALVLLATSVTHAQTSDPFNKALLESFTYRNLGPFRMGARTSDIAVPNSTRPEHRHTFYVGFWNGGVWKTTNNGTTFEPVFNGQTKLAIGDVTVAPSHPDVVWVGTGDAFTSRSSYSGDGVYKSLDAGRTWRNMGLRDSYHISRIVIHPTNPEIVYVAAMGHLHTPNAERGVFRTTNGGNSWEKVLFVNDRVGLVDLVINPREPSILYAAAYDKQRLPWQYINSGPGSGIYRSTDAGATWTKLGNGLPRGGMGRIGLDIYPKNPDIVYAVVENASTRMGIPAILGGPDRVSIVGGEVYRTDNGGTSWRKMNSGQDNVSEKGPYYFSQIRVDPNDDQRIFVTGVSLGNSFDGGRTWSDITWPPRRMFRGIFGDVRTLWIDPDDSNRMILGSDGGFYISYDGGQTSDHLPNIPVGEVYAIGVDMEEPYNIYAGLQDHENWRGPSNGASGEVTTYDWLALGDGDGMFTVPDTTDSRWLYTTRQYGGQQRVDQRLGYRTSIMPRRPAGQPPYRFQWNTPFMISPHNSSVVYTGAQVLLRSRNRGDTWEEISPDLSTNPTDRILPSSEGGVPGGIPWFAITSIAESPVQRGVIWAGTSDGRVHVTRDDGGSWADMTQKLTALGAHEDAYVSRVRASHHVAGRAYIAKNGYKWDDFRPFLYRTDDFGATWRSISNGLPNEPINVVWEDAKNPNLLFVGNDTGIFVSIDGGASWVKMNANIPNVPVHDLIVHPRDNDLVVGTYGRSMWVTNIAPLQELNRDLLAQDVHMFRIQPTVQRITWSFGSNDYLFAQRHIVTPNAPNGMVVRYYLKNAGDARAQIVVADASGREVGRLQGSTNAGINTVVWNTRVAGQGGRPGGDPLSQWAPLGAYTVTLDVDGKRFTQTGTIVRMQGWSLGATPQTIR
jgi:photosystem II stability/assembly factor-like uncharacterized protein